MSLDYQVIMILLAVLGIMAYFICNAKIQAYLSEDMPDGTQKDTKKKEHHRIRRN